MKALVFALSLLAGFSAGAANVVCTGEGYYPNSPQTAHKVVFKVQQEDSWTSASLSVDGGIARSWGVEQTNFAGGVHYSPPVFNGVRDFDFYLGNNGLADLRLHYPPFIAEKLSCLLPARIE